MGTFARRTGLTAVRPTGVDPSIDSTIIHLAIGRAFLTNAPNCESSSSNARFFASPAADRPRQRWLTFARRCDQKTTNSAVPVSSVTV